MKITSDTRITPHPEVVSRLVEGEVVLLNVASGEYYSLDEVGSRAWALMADDGVTVSELCRTLEAEFEAPVGVIAQDVCALCEALVAADLLVAG